MRGEGLFLFEHVPQTKEIAMANVYEIITDRIIKQLESGAAPWHKPWQTRGQGGLPRNLITGHEYRGINVWVLLSSGHSSPYWLTFRQTKELDGHVRHGESGLPIVYWQFGRREVQDGVEVIEKRSVLCRYYTVFNSEQCEGLRLQPLQPVEDQPQVDPIQSCEQVVSDWQTKPAIRHGGDKACYSKNLDYVQMPDRSSFEGAEEYYSTLFHELTHSTGHPERLNRQTLTEFERFGDANYSREELVAEMGAAFLAGYCGIENRTINNSTAYLASWLKALQDDSRLVLVAAGQAQRAADLILGHQSLSAMGVTI
jgi:antirestriction protein ArdC